MKSHVSMEQHQCPVCLAVFDTGAILLDTRLRDSMEPHTVTGRSPCPECDSKLKEGYVALIEADDKTRERKGRIAWLRASAWPNVFAAPVPEHGICMVPGEIIDMLEGLSHDA